MGNSYVLIVFSIHHLFVKQICAVLAFNVHVAPFNPLQLFEVVLYCLADRRGNRYPRLYYSLGAARVRYQAVHLHHEDGARELVQQPHHVLVQQLLLSLVAGEPLHLLNRLLSPAVADVYRKYDRGDRVAELPLALQLVG